MLLVSVILVWTFKSFLEFRGLALSDISFVLTNRSSPWRICLRFCHVHLFGPQVILTVKSLVWGNQVISSVLSIVWLHVNWVWQSGRQFCQQSLSQPVHWLWPVMSKSVSHGFGGQTFQEFLTKHTVFVKKGSVDIDFSSLVELAFPLCFRHSCQEVWSFLPFLVETFQLFLDIRPIVFVSHAFGAWQLVNLLGTDIQLSRQSCCLLVRIGQIDKLPNYFNDISMALQTGHLPCHPFIWVESMSC